MNAPGSDHLEKLLIVNDALCLQLSDAPQYRAGPNIIIFDSAVEHGSDVETYRGDVLPLARYYPRSCSDVSIMYIPL